MARSLSNAGLINNGSQFKVWDGFLFSPVDTQMVELDPDHLVCFLNGPQFSPHGFSCSIYEDLDSKSHQF